MSKNESHVLYQHKHRAEDTKDVQQEDGRNSFNLVTGSGQEFNH